ncbi:MAG: PAC2 family protein [Actinomycetota bacterium]
MTLEPMRFEREVTLRDPVMIAAFKGWNDAGDAATFAASHLARVWGAERFATIDPEEFFDFQAVRPQVELEDGMTRKITWPSNEFFAAKMPGAPNDVLIMVGTEPSHRWRTFSSLVIDVAHTHEVSMVVTLGSLLADVPHSRPTHISGTAADSDLISKLDLQRSRYEGPTGIVGVLHDAFAEVGIPSASLWAAVPHYLAVTPNPKAALALVDRAVRVTEISAEVDGLERATHAYEERVAEIVASDEDVQSYVNLLEERADEREQEEIDTGDLPTGESLAAELEEFLRGRDS